MFLEMAFMFLKVFVVGGAVCTFVDKKIVNFVGAGLLVLGAVMFFLMPNFVVCADTILGKVFAQIDYVITTGAVVSAVASIGAAALVAFKAVAKK